MNFSNKKEYCSTVGGPKRCFSITIFRRDWGLQSRGWKFLLRAEKLKNAFRHSFASSSFFCFLPSSSWSLVVCTATSSSPAT